MTEVSEKMEVLKAQAVRLYRLRIGENPVERCFR